MAGNPKLPSAEVIEGIYTRTYITLLNLMQFHLLTTVEYAAAIGKYQLDMSETFLRERAYSLAWDFDDKAEHLIDEEEVFIPESVCYHVVLIERGTGAAIISVHFTVY